MGSATFTHFHTVIILGNKKVQDFRYGTRRHIGFKNFLDFSYFIPRFFFGFLSYAIFGIIFIQQSSTRFYHHSRGIPIHVGWQSKLFGENDGFIFFMIKKYGGPISSVICFPGLCFPFAILFLIIEGYFIEG